MSATSEQIQELRDVADGFTHKGICRMARQAAETIEELSAKLASANIERSTAYYNNGWIPVSAPPKKDGFYVVTFDGELCGEDAPFVGMCEFEDGEWMEDCVLAWKEQTPYKPEGE